MVVVREETVVLLVEMVIRVVV